MVLAKLNHGITKRKDKYGFCERCGKLLTMERLHYLGGWQSGIKRTGFVSYFCVGCAVLKR